SLRAAASLDRLGVPVSAGLSHAVMRWVCFVAILLAVPVRPATAAAERLDVVIRGKTLTAWVYRPAGVPRGTVIMGSGDVGWVGLGVDMAQFLSLQGYVVVGVNVRQY